MTASRLHIIGLFHTVPSRSYSHCAYTGKVLRFSKMMRPFGYEVVEYANEGSESEASEKVVILAAPEFESHFGGRGNREFVGDRAHLGSSGHALFDRRLRAEMALRIRPGDIVCHPFGHSHQGLLALFPDNIHVETGVGYPTLMPGSFRIFESYAWLHYHLGMARRGGSHYEWVIPNYYDLDEWEPSYEAGGYIAFLGRICANKGMDTVYEIARHIDVKIVLCGQGDPTPWSHENIEYRGPLEGRERSDFLRGAICSIMPTVYVEPFGGSGVESMLCGTPLISVDYGAFTETVQQGVSGYRCKTLRQWLDAIENARGMDRRLVAEYARKRYGLSACGVMYDQAFRQLMGLYGEGWGAS